MAYLLAIDITEEMANRLDEIAKKGLVSREDVAKVALSAYAVKHSDKESKFFGLGLDDIGQVLAAVSESIIELSDQRSRIKS